MSKQSEAPDVIYLLETDESEWVWCDDPAPGPYDDPDDAVKYIKEGVTALPKITDKIFRE